MKISFIQPSRNNLRYLKWSYDSIRKNQGDHEVQICIADDASTDGTKEWLEEVSKTDKNLDYIVNDTGKRLGHTILYDRLVKEVAKYELCMIYHADMFLCPGALDAIEKHMYSGIYTINVGTTPAKELSDLFEKIQSEYNNSTNRDKLRTEIDALGVPYTYDKYGIANVKTIVSLTRIEPPLHPEGPEKIIADFGTEPEDFNEDGLLKFVKNLRKENEGKTTEGIFAPWAFWKSEFLEIGGHDPLYKPQSKEDSDIFNRFQLNGTKFIQTWEGFVYHMTCRGSRRNTHDGAPNIQTNNPEWEAQNIRSTRNFIRKWGSFVKHDEYMKPIVLPKYHTTFILKNIVPPIGVISYFEPWCNVLIFDNKNNVKEQYIEQEQQNTLYDLNKRLRPDLFDQKVEDVINNEYHDVVVEIPLNTLTDTDIQYIFNIPRLVKDAAELKNWYQIGNILLYIDKKIDTVNELIVNKEVYE